MTNKINKINQETLNNIKFLKKEFTNTHFDLLANIIEKYWYNCYLDKPEDQFEIFISKDSKVNFENCILAFDHKDGTEFWISYSSWKTTPIGCPKLDEIQKQILKDFIKIARKEQLAFTIDSDIQLNPKDFYAI